MNRITGVVQLHLKNRLSWFILPWSILLIPDFGINLLISLLVKKPIYTGGMSSIYIFMFIAGALTLNDTLPFSLGFSIRRIDYFLGTMLTATLVSFISALALLLLSLVEHNLTGGWGVALHFFHLPYLNDGPIIGQFWIYFSAMLHLYLLGFVITSVYYRFGRTGMYSLFIVASLIATLVGFLLTYFNWWGGMFGWIAQYSALELSLWALPFMLVYVLLAYLFLRKATA